MNDWHHFWARAVWYPIWERRRGINVHEKLRLLEESTSWDRQRLDEYRNTRLQALIQHAYENVPFYSNRMRTLGIQPEDIQTVADLVKLPPLTRSDLQASRQELIARGMEYPPALIRFIQRLDW